MKKTKKTLIFSTSFLSILVYILNNPIMFGFCKNISAWSNGIKYCVDENVISEEISVLVFCLSVFVLFFSLLTYRMHDSVFRAWWNFARWWVPVIVVMTFIVNAQPHNGSFFSMQAFSNAVTIGFFYAIFVIVSLVQIVRAYRRSKK